MPHVILEYSANIIEPINFNDLFHELHIILHQIANANIADCKSRAVKLDNYYIGDGNKKNGLLHLEILLMAGRTEIIKQKLGAAILSMLKKYYQQSLDQLKLGISLKITEISSELYFKNN